MKGVALALLVALPAFADDSPKLCLEPSERIALAQSLVAKDARIASLEQSVREAPSVPLIVALVVGAAVAGVAAGYGVSRVIK